MGWHKFEIERMPDNKTVKFFVDGILGRTITDVSPEPLTSVAIGSMASANITGKAWFDDVKVEYLGPPQVAGAAEEDSGPKKKMHKSKRL
jgi:hypothetical protein